MQLFITNDRLLHGQELTYLSTESTFELYILEEITYQFDTTWYSAPYLGMINNLLYFTVVLSPGLPEDIAYPNVMK